MNLLKWFSKTPEPNYSIMVFGLMFLTVGLILGLQYQCSGCSIYSDKNEGNLKIEQRVACYKGCQFTTQPLFYNCVDDSDFRQKQYTKCINLCDYRYEE